MSEHAAPAGDRHERGRLGLRVILAEHLSKRRLPRARERVAAGIEGLTLEGQTLTASTGTWTGSPRSFSYQWRICDGLGLSCEAIAGATSATLGLNATDVGHTLQVLVTAKNAGGSSAASSPASLVVLGLPPLAPVNTSAPAITGVAVEGETVKASTGAWTGSPTSFSYEWQDCNGAGTSCVPIGEANGPTYLLGASDVGETLRVQVTATNAGGSTAATSPHTAVVEVAPPPAPVNLSLPVIKGSEVEGQTLEATAGTWTESPSSFSYQWQDCNSAGSSWVSISERPPPATRSPPPTPATRPRPGEGDERRWLESASSAATGLVQVLPPASTSLPAITGQALEGQTLKASSGSWSGSPTSFPTSGRTATDPARRVSRSRVPRLELHARRLGFGSHDPGPVTATNSGGSTAATSSQTGVVGVLPPGSTTLPAISGSSVEGQSLTASDGSWSGSPTSFSYQWEDCNSAGSSCVAISGAGSSGYTLTGADVGHTVRVQVTATNAGGSTAASSAQTGLVQVLPPANSSLPAISGTATEGQSLKASNGSWSGSPTSFSYQWQDCDSSGASCSAISGATGLSYTLTETDAGHTIRVQVGAINSGGAGSATSAQTAWCRSPPPPTSPCRRSAARLSKASR